MSAPLREVRRQETRKALLEAAEEVLAAHGLGEARVEEIAERAGVSVGTIYNYFEDRDRLVAELLDARRGELEERLDAVGEASRGSSLRAQVEALARAVFEHFEEHRPFLQVTLEIEHQKSMTALRAAKMKHPTSMRCIYAAAQALVERGVADKDLRADDSDMWASFLTGTLRASLIHELHHDSRRSADEKARLVARFFLDGAEA